MLRPPNPLKAWVGLKPCKYVPIQGAAFRSQPLPAIRKQLVAEALEAQEAAAEEEEEEAGCTAQSRSRLPAGATMAWRASAAIDENPARSDPAQTPALHHLLTTTLVKATALHAGTYMPIRLLFICTTSRPCPLHPLASTRIPKQRLIHQTIS